MKHLTLDLDVSFEDRRIAGTATLDLAQPSEGDPVVLDTRDLTILSVRAGSRGQLTDVPFELGPRHAVQGSHLRIQAPAGTERIEVRYHSSPDATALQWLTPEQTSGKEAPFLYTQGQTNHTRSWIPCVDEPHVRTTFEATVRVPAGLRAVMGAEDLGDSGDGSFRFRMPQPVPSYLIALAVGRLESRELGPRTLVVAEPEVIAAAAHEFADTEAMIEATETLFGPYRWGTYGLLVLPPSFPLGGMENPRLTFATPTILAGDRSLVSLVAHELAHAWSGNLVTNASWDDLWLNEGFTVYLERRITEEIYGRDRSEMEAALGRARLEETIRRLGADHLDTRLHMEVGDRDPDETLTDVPYEKGYLFLRRLEEAFGRPRFDRFLRRWFDDHAFRTATSNDFVGFLAEGLMKEDPETAAAIDIRLWVFGPGLPADAPRAQPSAFHRVRVAADQWLVDETLDAGQTDAWSAQEWIHFVQRLPRDLSVDRMAQLDQRFGLTTTGNSEILAEWLQLSIATGYGDAAARLEEFLLTVGRKKFVKPLYEEMLRTPEGQIRAREIYARARRSYHAMTTVTLDAMLS